MFGQGHADVIHEDPFQRHQRLVKRRWLTRM